MVGGMTMIKAANIHFCVNSIPHDANFDGVIRLSDGGHMLLFDDIRIAGDKIPNNIYMIVNPSEIKTGHVDLNDFIKLAKRSKSNSRYITKYELQHIGVIRYAEPEKVSAV